MVRAGGVAMMPLETERDVARLIDQTNLRPEATAAEITDFVTEAKENKFCAVAIMPGWIPLASQLLGVGDTTIVAAIGFPLGTTPTEGKVAETVWALKNGPPGTEIDMVMNISLLKSRRYGEVEKDIAEVIAAAKGHIVKVIIEAPLLTPDEIVVASGLCEKTGADFVKTSTGFKAFRGWRPSTVEDVVLIRQAVGDRLRIKVAGGIKNLEQLLAVVEAGASRIGTSSGVEILHTFRRLGEAKARPRPELALARGRETVDDR
jgi:deoxyribose-phosphate aldolase